MVAIIEDHGRAARATRPRARKIRKPLGPFQTDATSFEAGRARPIEIVRLTPKCVTYRIKGRPGEFTVTHAVAFLRAVSAEADFDTGPRVGKRIRG